MDSFDYTDDGGVQPTRDRAGTIFNIATVLVLLVTACVCIVFATIFLNPYIGFNPFPPPTINPAEITPTVTPTPPVGLPPTWTPTVTSQFTPEPTGTNTSVPTFTQPVETQIPPENEATATPEADLPTATPNEEMPFVLHPGDPRVIANIGYPDLGCDWMGVAGVAFDLTGATIEQGILIQLQGVLGGEAVDMLGSVGMVDTYGPGSYEFVLGDTPKSSTQTLTIQLFDQAMLPLSNPIPFDTFNDCDKNLILINFNQIR
jgi:hypothetical protein